MRKINDPTPTEADRRLRAKGKVRYESVRDLETEGIVDINNIGLTMSNLVRLRLITINRKDDKLTPTSISGAGAGLTAFGVDFVLAAQLPRKRGFVLSLWAKSE